jgi:di/tricarboxylate transporter
MIIIFSGLIAFISSVMQNTGAAVLFLPAIRFTASRKVMVSISRVLMPIGMSAILGGTLTMIGTSPLILLNDLLPPEIRKFGLLDLTPIGLALVTGGITYFALFGKYLLKKTGKKQDNELNNNGFFDIKHPLKEYKELDGPFELYIPNNYKAGTKPNKIMTIQKEYSVNIVAVASNQEIENSAPLPDTVIKPHTSICVFGPDENVNNFAKEYGLVLLPELKKFKNYINPAITDIVEIIISPRSTFIGKTITDIGFRNTFRVNELALYQDGKVYYKQLSDMHLKAGDAILLHGTLERLHMLKKLHQNFIITSPISADPQKSVKPIPALICFVCTLFLMVFSSFYFQNRSFNPIPLSVCLMLGALGMILSGVLTINEAYRSVDWRTVFLLGGLLPLGMSVDQTGTAEWMAEGIISLIGENTPPFLLLAMLATLSAAFTLVISNVGACTLLVPLGISLSSQIGIDPRVAAIVIGIGVSNSFILPTHQVNALYMGPGGYKTLDYIKVGLPLSILYIGILVSMTYLFYL